MSHERRDNDKKVSGIGFESPSGKDEMARQRMIVEYTRMKQEGNAAADPVQRRAEEWQRICRSEAAAPVPVKMEKSPECQQQDSDAERQRQELERRQQEVAQQRREAEQQRKEAERQKLEAEQQRRRQMAEALREPVAEEYKARQAEVQARDVQPQESRSTACQPQEVLPKAAQTLFTRPAEEQFGYFCNGRRGAQYSCEVKFPPEVVDCVISGLEPFGLQYRFRPEQHICLVYGTPTVAGEAILDLKLSVRSGQQTTEMLLRRAVTFNPDPRDLWKDIPTPPDMEYYKPDSDTRRLVCTPHGGDAWKVVAASRRGRSHAHTGKPRDDHFMVDYAEETGWFMLAVADGAGSAPCSRKGSELACLTVHEQMCPRLAELDAAFMRYADGQQPELRQAAAALAYDVLSRAAWEARQSIQREAQRTGRDSREYATTLMLVLCKPFSFGWVFACFGVGDGAMAVLKMQDGRPALHLLAEPDEGEFSGQTCFLTMSRIFQADELHRRISIHFVPDVTALLLMTDGISDARFDGDVALHTLSCWESLWQELQGMLAESSGTEAEALLDWLNFWSKGNHDDRTMALVYR